jgi:hypothetical protein
VAAYERVSWRRALSSAVIPRAYDPARGHPRILAVVPNKTEYPWEEKQRHPAWMATERGWGLTPRAGFIKVLKEEPACA